MPTPELRAMPRCANHGREGCFAEDCAREHVRRLLAERDALRAAKKPRKR